MKSIIPSALALLLGLAVPAAAQQQQPGAAAGGVTNPELQASQAIAADADADRRVTAEEETIYAERRFTEIDADRSGTLSPEEYAGAMTQAENPTGMLDEIDLDGDGAVSLEEWTTWREMRWAEAVGGAEGLPVKDYETFDLGGEVSRQ